MLRIDPDRIAIPLVVAVTGHRDLVPDEVPGIRDRVRGLLGELRAKYPDRRLRVMSPLAEGADRLVAEEALALGVELIVPLPMPRELYVADFQEAGDLCLGNPKGLFVGRLMSLKMAACSEIQHPEAVVGAAMARDPYHNCEIADDILGALPPLPTL